jgi:hypothetical protein
MLTAVSYFNFKWPCWERCSLLNQEFCSTLLRSSFSQICPCSGQWYESFQVWRVGLLNGLLKSHCCCWRIFMYSAICTENRNKTALNFGIERCWFIVFISYFFLVLVEMCIGFSPQEPCIFLYVIPFFFLFVSFCIWTRIFNLVYVNVVLNGRSCTIIECLASRAGLCPWDNWGKANSRRPHKNLQKKNEALQYCDSN